MSARLVNLALLASVPLLVMTGLLAWAVPELGAVLLALHRASAGALLVVLAWKVGIARRSIDVRLATGRAGTLLVGFVTSAALLIVLGIGLAWTVGAVSFDRPLPYSLLNVHVALGIALVPLVIAHMAQRRDRLRGAAGRRDVLRLAAASAAGLLVASVVDRIALTRRETGSREAGSQSGNEFPVTIWTFDRVPDVSEWRLRVRGAVVLESVHSYEGFLGLPHVTRDVVLDCTGGWWSAQRWRGVRLGQLFTPLPEASRVRIVSLTGHSATFPLPADDVLLATHVGDEPLALAHGFPVRAVAPGHRGFAWVKWVTRIEVF